ncbi:MAG: hypothetical protein HOJ54_00860 [Phycisphaerae bacterium]|nr:hypothetical protein [Phycisphaerae bacterium]
MTKQPSDKSFDGMTSVASEPGVVAWEPDVPQWVAVVSIVIGVLGILCWGGQGILAMSMQGVEGVDMPESSRGHLLFERFGFISATLLGIWLIVAGAGAAGGSIWGRTAIRSWAWIRILLAVIGLIGAFYWFDEVLSASLQAVQKEMAQAVAENAPPANTPSITESAMRAILTIWVVAMSVAICVWPVVVLIVTRRKSNA